MGNSRAMRRQIGRAQALPRLAGSPSRPAPAVPPRREVTIAYGARCTWWDDKSKAAAKPSGLPCCPHCGGVLFESEMEEWWSGAHRHQEGGVADYVPFLRWLQGQCFPNFDAAWDAFRTAGAGQTGGEVNDEHS